MRAQAMLRRLAATLAAALLLGGPALAQGKTGAQAVYESACAGCHATGVLDAPKFGNAAQWAPRTAGGLDALVKRAAAGTAKGMPPRGGRADLSDAQLRAVIEYMVAGGAPAGAAKAAAAPAAAPAATPVVAAAPVAPTATPPATPPAAPTPAA